jgi:hypothetical protein
LLPVPGERDLTLPLRYKEGFSKTGLLLLAMAAIDLKSIAFLWGKRAYGTVPPGFAHPGSSDSKPWPLSYALRKAIADIIALVYKKITL